MYTASFVDGPREGEQDFIFGREPQEGERVYYMNFGPQGWVRVLESWESEAGCLIYELKSANVVSLDKAGGPGQDQGVAEYTFIRQVGVRGDAGGEATDTE